MATHYLFRRSPIHSFSEATGMEYLANIVLLRQVLALSLLYYNIYNTDIVDRNAVFVEPIAYTCLGRTKQFDSN